MSLLVSAWMVLAMLASKGPFRWLALGLRSGLDVALDVINWLRLNPVKSNPRSRICARFYSLLRHIDERGAADGSGYSAIVIIAHSQGTVITADLLRYLHSKGMAPQLPIYLFTMGCPLRQLYGLRFPHLYGWACDSSETWPCKGPDPDEVGVAKWWNTYASGDYVGRYLWYSDAITSGQRWEVYSDQQAHGQRREFCIGAGAHTHYWDGTWSEIAFELDQLIAIAATDAASRQLWAKAAAGVRAGQSGVAVGAETLNGHYPAQAGSSAGVGSMPSV